MLELRTLGLLDIRGPDGETLQSVLSQPKRLALLAYLAAATPRRFHRRDTLLALFWPELDDRHARGALRQALTYLRRELGEGVVLSRGMEEVGIDAAALRCDAHTFESALEDGDEQTALELYKGTFLEGFHVSDVAPEFDRWIETERRRLRRHAVEAAWRLAEGCRDSGDWAAAKLWANRAFSFAASDESQLQRLVTLLDRIGDRAAALRAYEEFAQRLARDLDAEPSPETQALIQAVRSRAADRSEEDASAGLAPAAEATALSQTPDGPRRGRRITMRLAALLAGAALVTLVVAAVATMPGRGASLKPERVVVSSLRNRTGDPELDPVGQMASDWITQGLVRSGLVDVVPPTTALLSSRLLAEPTNDGGEVDSGGRVRSLAEETKAGIVVWGSYYVNGDSLYFVAQISDATDNEMVAGIDPIGTPIEDPLPGIETLRQRVMGALGVLFNARLAVLATETVQPPTFAAYREYAVGLEHFFRREFEEAARHFHHAAELDTTYVQPLVWEATADIFLSEWGDAARAAGAAERHRERLLPSERAWLDYTQGILNGDFAAASQAVRRANTIAPTPLWTYMQGVLAVFTNQPGQVPELWERLDPEGEIFTGWWQYWEWPTEAYHLLGQHRRELETARRARRQYPEFLTTLSFETIALAALGRVEEVNARIDECLALPPQQRRRPAFLMLRASEELRAHGHPESADEVVQRAIRWYRTLGPEEAELEINRFDYARALYMAGDYDEAEAIFESLSGDWARTVGYKVSTPHHVSVVGAVGVVAAARGDREEAMRISQQLEDLERHPISRRPVPAWQAAIAAQLGEKERAVNLLGQALSHGLLHGPQIHSDFDFAPLQDYPPFRTLVRPKG